MSPRRKLSREVEDFVRGRAGYLCEYCHSSEWWQYVEFTVDHIVPLSLGGSDDPQNQALACFHCNRRKSDRQSAADPLTGEVTALFHPRLHRWDEHFVWSMDGSSLIGLTPIGRATAALLNFNRERAILIRSADARAGRHPPPSDPRREKP